MTQNCEFSAILSSHIGYSEHLHRMKSATAMLRTATPQYTNDQAHPCWEGSFLHCACAWQRNANATTKDAITNDVLMLPIGHLRGPDRKGWSQRVCMWSLWTTVCVHVLALLAWKALGSNYHRSNSFHRIKGRQKGSGIVQPPLSLI